MSWHGMALDRNAQQRASQVKASQGKARRQREINVARNNIEQKPMISAHFCNIVRGQSNHVV